VIPFSLTRCALPIDRLIHACTGQCGSCWAFGTGGSFADRLCIASNASKVELAPVCRLLPLYHVRVQVLEDGASYQEIIACDRIPPNNACNGGVPRLVWDWAEAFSVASNECYEYTAGSGSDSPSCTEYLLNSSPKRSGCEHKYTLPPAPRPSPPTPPPSSPVRYRVKAGSTTHFTTVDAIQAAVYADGSVSASFNV
jgi:hypothetical protein